MNIVIIKYNAGNIQSVLFALERIGMQATVTDDPGLIKTADKVIFPGVGEASTAMQYLRERKLDVLIRELQQPVLGICLGMQLLCQYSEENNTNCLGVFENVTVRKFNPAGTNLKVPQIGWNTITDLQSGLFANLPGKSYCYFVHGYYAEENKYSIARTNYIQSYSSALQKDNFYGVQFHPEKSAVVGEQILKNFLVL
ncbi:MAG: imidazole glycerol phosphate synthase subunit HisH [Bacteroidota bacterium]|nr:imidazole glycerol phosphate synthase subunit HisH [Bacteroidota bacterium]